MSEFRSKSYGDGRNTQIQIQNNHNNNNQNKQQLEKSYSYAGTGFDYSGHENGPKLKKNGSNKNNNWMVLSDPELQRKKRVATYKAYTVEGKVKGGFKKGFRWIKDRYNLVLHGWKSP